MNFVHGQNTLELQVNPEVMLAQVYRQLATVGNIYGENSEIGNSVGDILRRLDELKQLTSDPLSEKGVGIDHETEGEQLVKT